MPQIEEGTKYEKTLFKNPHFNSCNFIQKLAFNIKVVQLDKSLVLMKFTVYILNRWGRRGSEKNWILYKLGCSLFMYKLHMFM